VARCGGRRPLYPIAAARLLLVEDDETIGHALRTSLTAHGHEVRWESTGHRASRAALAEPFDVILTARDEEMDVIIGLEAGADDYLTKPIRLAELHARIRAHLRRVDSAGRPEPSGRAALGDVVIDSASRRVTLAGTELPLRAKEYELLARLAAQPGVAVSRDTLMADVWDENWFGSTKTLDVHVAALRRQLGQGTDGAVVRRS
jgi:DNA-binding response OmpR family regulator